MVIVIVFYIISGLIWGFATQMILDNKGYDENGFWWGFFFQLIAVLVALSKPEIDTSGEYYAETSEKLRKADAMQNGAWVCSRCGKFNYPYMTSCICGMSKEENVKPAPIAFNAGEVEEREETTDNNAPAAEDPYEGLKKLKELLDLGAISKDEYEDKKAVLLHKIS